VGQLKQAACCTLVQLFGSPVRRLRPLPTGHHATGSAVRCRPVTDPTAKLIVRQGGALTGAAPLNGSTLLGTLGAAPLNGSTLLETLAMFKKIGTSVT
jgi:hypothetical protein